MNKPKLLNAQKILLWCDLCGKKSWLRAKTIEDILLEAMWHKRGYCVVRKKSR